MKLKICHFFLLRDVGFLLFYFPFKAFWSGWLWRAAATWAEGRRRVFAVDGDSFRVLRVNLRHLVERLDWPTDSTLIYSSNRQRFQIVSLVPYGATRSARIGSKLLSAWLGLLTFDLWPAARAKGGKAWMKNTRHVVTVHSSTDFPQLCRDVEDHNVNIDVNKRWIWVWIVALFFSKQNGDAEGKKGVIIDNQTMSDKG